MDFLIHKIKSLQEHKTLSKHQRISLAITEAIDAKKLGIGDKLPSINLMVSKIGYARRTVVKAYEVLKEKGLVASKQNKGYFIIDTNTQINTKVALVLFAYQSIQEDFHTVFTEALGETYRVDIFFHHNNIPLFKSILKSIIGNYGKYVVAPIQNEALIPLLNGLEAQKLLLVDRYINVGPNISYVTQEFQKNTYSILEDYKNVIGKYNAIHFIFNPSNDYSPEVLKKVFLEFVTNNSMNHEIYKTMQEDKVKKGIIFFVKNDSCLWPLIKTCKNKGLVVGQDVGVLSYDDNILKELVCEGISTISTDFKRMAELAAQHIRDNTLMQEIVPTKMVWRKSL